MVAAAKGPHAGGKTAQDEQVRIAEERPLAIVILGGLFTSTFLNMIVVPTLFRRFARKAFEAGESEHDAQIVFVSQTELDTR